jgi:hypothetical protein
MWYRIALRGSNPAADNLLSAHIPQVVEDTTKFRTSGHTYCPFQVPRRPKPRDHGDILQDIAGSFIVYSANARDHWPRRDCCLSDSPRSATWPGSSAARLLCLRLSISGLPHLLRLPPKGGVAGMLRNGGRFAPEWVAEIGRNQWPEWSGIRT